MNYLDFTRPAVILNGVDTRILAHVCAQALIAVGLAERSLELKEKVMASKTFAEAKNWMMIFCDVRNWS